MHPKVICALRWRFSVRQTPTHTCFSNAPCGLKAGLRHGLLAQDPGMSKGDNLFARTVHIAELQQLLTKLRFSPNSSFSSIFVTHRASLVQMTPCQLQLSNQMA
jgi:hypothetical protein